MKLFTTDPKVTGHSVFTFAVSSESKIAKALEVHTGADTYQVKPTTEGKFEAYSNGTLIFEVSEVEVTTPISTLIVVQVGDTKYVAPVDAPNFGEASDYIYNILDAGLEVPTLASYEALTNS